MEKIDKISKYGNLIGIFLLYTAFVVLVSGVMCEKSTKYYQAERLMAYDWYDGDCFDRVDINWIIYGINE